MPLADFTETGDLPVGVHSATLAEVVARFGANTRHRRALAARLERIREISLKTGQLLRFVIFGSFVTAKPEPNNVDVFMIMNDNFHVGNLSGEASLLFDHAAAQVHFGCSVFWVRRMAALGGEQVAVEDWQYKRDGSRRDIIEITGNAP